ncbi:hypothetical protein [Moritella marina]|uniref:hypothetical protein n=1 Tax=Moritella marina TaxID=90736 RepID=UPI0037042D01
MLLTENIMLKVKRSAQILSSTYIVLAGLLFSITMISYYYDIPISWFTRDPTVVLHGPSYVGFISNIGILFWAFTTAICLLSSIIRKQKYHKTTSQFLLYSGLLTLWLLLDDMFMLHDSFLPNHLMIPEKLVYLGYVAMVFVYLVKFRAEILKHEYVILLFAFCFFSLSVLADLLLEQQGYEFLLEDGFKLFGIVTWFIFFFRTCRHYLQQEES